MPRPPRKISTVLMEFAQPLLRALPADASAEAMQPVFELATLVWNAVVLEQRGSPKPYLEEARTLIAREFDEQHRAALLQTIADLETAKHRESPPDLRLITRYEVIEDGPGRMSLRAESSHVGTSPLPSRTRRPTTHPPPHSRAGDESWIALYQAAVQLRALAPWRWMGDDERFGIEDPATGRIDWCVLMGIGETFEGLALYLGDSGLEQLERMLAEDEDDDAIASGQDALVLGFVDREMTAPEERARIKRLGFSFRGRGAWPQLDSQGLDRLPREPTAADAGRMAEAIEQVLDVARRAARAPELVLPSASGERLVRLVTKSPDGHTWIDARHPIPIFVEPPIPPFDQVRAARLRASLPSTPVRIECDVFPLPTVIDEPGEEPYVPALFMLVELRRGAIVHTDMHPPSGREAWAQDQLLRGFEVMNSRPEAVVVARARLERVLAPVAVALGVRIERVEHFVHLSEAREVLSQGMRNAE